MSESDSVVLPLYRDASLDGPTRAHGSPHPMSGLHPGLVVLRDWPRRTALVVGDDPAPLVPAILHRFGFSTAVTTLSRAGTVAAALGPFTFLVLCADALASEESSAAIRALHAYSPSARLLLERPAGELDSAVVLRALRAGVVDVVDVNAEDLSAAISSGLRRAGSLRERVLAIGAHPDDVEIGCAGTLLDHRLRGDRVSILTLSRGTVGGVQAERVEESSVTAEAIGAQLILANLPDAQIDDGIATIRLIESVIRTVDPSVIYVHSKHDGHQDHRAVATAVASAARGVRRVFAFQSPSATNEFKPTQFVTIDRVLQRKIQVLKMFTSQKGRDYLDPELVVAGSRYWARHLGANARYAEPFEVIRSVGDLRQSAGILGTLSDSQPGFAIPSYASAPVAIQKQMDGS
jgi:LmbE family N-acetylglucosaminyl deacetylase